MGPFDDGSQVRDRSGGARILDQQPVHTVEIHRGRISDHDFEAYRLGSGSHHRDSLGVAGLVHHEAVAPAAPAHPVQQGHGLGRGGGLVQQRGVGEIHRRQLADHGLEVEQRLQAALGYLRLVGGVGRVPARILEHVASDDGRGDGLVVAHTEHRHHLAVGAGHLPQLVVVGLAGAELGQSHRLPLAHVVGDGAIDELVHVGHTDGGEHLGDLGGGWAYVTGLEGSPVPEVVVAEPGGFGVCHRCGNLPGALSRPVFRPAASDPGANCVRTLAAVAEGASSLPDRPRKPTETGRPGR